MRRLGKIIICLVFIFFSYLLLATLINRRNAHFTPDYAKIDLMPILSKDNLTDDDYRTLFFQTGLGKIAIDQLRNEGDTDKIIHFQDQFFKPIKITREQSDFTTAEFIKGEELLLAPYQDGYVLATLSSYTLGWRHGHAGIIINAQEHETLEAKTLGVKSQIGHTLRWQTRPTFIMLRLKTDDTELAEIAAFAKETLLGQVYKPLIGLTSPKNPAVDKLNGTHCSHLVYYPFKQFGYDIDSDGGWLVTPHDIIHSKLFEVVQIYGFNPHDFYHRAK